MIIFQHALQNLFQVADLKDKKKKSEKEVKKKTTQKTRLLKGILSYPAVSQITLRRQLAPLSSLILPSHVSLNQEGSLLMRAQENSGDNKDDTSLDIKDSQEATGQ